MIFVKIDKLGDSSIATEGYNDGNWFSADSFSFGVERELKDSGEKGGTQDINIGVGDLQVCVITKQLDLASPHLAQYSINGNSVGSAEIDFVEYGGGTAPPVVYLKYRLDRCFVKSWITYSETDNRPTEEVAFYFNKIAFQYVQPKDVGSFEVSSVMSWDNVKNIPWPSHQIDLSGGSGKKRKRTSRKKRK